MAFTINLLYYKIVSQVEGSVEYRLERLSTSEVTTLDLGPGASCWKVGSYLLIASGLQCRILTN